MTASVGALPYWDNFARFYEALVSPLIPTREDLGFTEEAIENWAYSHPRDRLNALLLGATPGLAGMNWPEGSRLTAIDRSMEIAKIIWPGNIPGQRSMVCGDWFNLPLGRESCSVVLADCSINCVRYPDGFRDLMASVRRVLRDDGILVMRAFVQPDQQEDPESVFADRFQCANFHHFKLRLMMAMQRSVEQGIPVNEVYRFWTSQCVDKELLSLRTGWERREIETIELHNGPNTIHTFPTIDELRSVLEEYFGEIRKCVPTYPGGNLCPTLVLRP
jgi:SAM-dependent methyltransferase